MRRMIVRPLRGGFSLVEIVLALAIISFALVAIMGMFPAAMNSARDSQRDTQAALIARRIFTDLRAMTPFIQKNSSQPGEDDLVEFTRETTTRVAYDESGALPGPVPEGAAPSSGRPIYGAQVTITPNSPSAKIARVEVTISTPAEAPPAHQKAYRFVSLLEMP